MFRNTSFTLTRSTLISGIVGVVVGLSSFVLFNPEMASNLVADISGNPSSTIAGDVYYKVSKNKISLYSNVTFDNIKSISVIVAYEPGTEVLTENDHVSAELLSPTMSRYILSTKTIEKGELIASRAYRGKPEDIVISDTQLYTEDQVMGLSVSHD